MIFNSIYTYIYILYTYFYYINEMYFSKCVQSAPYCMLKDTPIKMSGNDQFEGYVIDLIHEMSKILGFNYTFRLVPDGRYGAYNKETG